MIVRHRPTLFPGFDRSVDQVFEQLTSSFSDARRRAPAVEALWRDGTLQLTVDLPGVPADAVSVEVAGRTLTMGAHTEEIEWTRSLQLGGSLDPEKVSARHVDGRLTITVGAVDAPATRSIEIDRSPAPSPAIEASSEQSEQVESAEGDQSTERTANG